MKCQSGISKFCEKDFPKKKAKYINKKIVCAKCYYLLNENNKNGE